MSLKKISIVIVNYNVKDLLNNCLKSIEEASKDLDVETIVVDNNSIDGSIEYLTPLFPKVKFISLNENLGFSKANNIGFKEASGEFVLILNPDTLLEDDTLKKMHDFMLANPKVGMAGCKVLNEDGSFQLACRRGFPSPWNSFSKLFGLQSLFPKTKLFSGYNLTYKSIDESYEVDALIGAFMFTRKEVLEEVNGFDETFFMYGEDLDLCYKIKEAGYQIYYYHECSIIHYKGESTKRSSIKEIKHFYQAMEIYAKKHFSYSSLFLTFLRVGISFRSALAYFKKYKSDIAFLAIDVILIVFFFMLSNFYKYGNLVGYPEENFSLFVSILISFLFVIGLLQGLYFEDKPSIRKTFFTSIYSFIFVGFLTYLFRSFDQSRTVLLLSFLQFGLVSSIFRMIFLRDLQKRIFRKFLILGNGKEKDRIVDYLRSIESKNIIVENKIQINNLELIKVKKDELINSQVSDIVIIGSNSFKSSEFNIIKVESLEDFIAKRLISETLGEELTRTKSPLEKPRVRFIKRIFDLIFSIILLSLGLPFIYLFNRNPRNFFHRTIEMFKGRYTLVGSYLDSENRYFKKGLTGLAHVNHPNNLNETEIKKMDDFYLSNSSLSLDIEIILKTFTKSSQV